MSHYVSNVQFSESHQAFLAAISVATEPKRYSEAIKHKVWCDSMKDEIVAQENSGTWDIASLPPGKKAIVPNGFIVLNIIQMEQFFVTSHG